MVEPRIDEQLKLFFNQVTCIFMYSEAACSFFKSSPSLPGEIPRAPSESARRGISSSRNKTVATYLEHPRVLEHARASGANVY